jgi:tetratricopeptide (TPR) repeat protein
MTTEPEVGPEKKFASTFLPWVIAGGALLVYLLTLNHWVSFSSLPQVTRLAGWSWQPEIYGPLFCLLTYPFRWLPPSAIPLALNLFAAVCAALSLALLARSVALLPHDRTHEQRQLQGPRSSYLSIPAAWIPPVLAALLCGLQLTFWEYATAGASPPPPWGSGCEMLDLLVFAYVLRCLLEYRVEERDSWLLRGALAMGLGITDNWAMLGFLPLFVVALIWIKGLSFFDLRFLGRLTSCLLAGLLLYLLLPLLHGGSSVSSVPFWPALKANVNAQRGILMMFYKFARQDVALLALTSLLPIFIISIRWASYFGDTSKLGVALATFMFHVVHALFLVAIIWVALDTPFSPRNKGMGSPFLTFYYLSALTVGYCSGYFLLIFGVKETRFRRLAPHVRLINNVVVAVIWVLLILTPIALAWRALPQIRVTNGPMLRNYAALQAQALPQKPAVLLSDDPRRSGLLQSYLAGSSAAKDYLFIDTAQLAYAEYHQFLKQKYPRVWESNPRIGATPRIEATTLIPIINRLALSNTLYYLHPSFGYYFEFFYPEAHGLVYKLNAYPTNRLYAPLPDKALRAENEQFWQQADTKVLASLQAGMSPWGAHKWPTVLDQVLEKLHLTREPNHEATTLATFYSRASDYWGVEMQRSGQLTNAATDFQRALDLNQDNMVAQVNLQCNENLRAGRKGSVQVSKSIEDEFGKYRNWDQIVGENGPFDEPSFCYEQGRVFVRNYQYRQAAAEFARVEVLAPENLAARLWLSQLYVVSQMPADALKIIDQIRAQPALASAAETNRTELLFVETSAHLGQNDVPGAEAVVDTAMHRFPGDAALLATATQVYLRYGRFSNALTTIERELQLAPTNLTALVNKGYACIQVKAYEEAIPALTKVLVLDTNNTSALLNLAIACLRVNRLEEAQRHYELLQKSFPTAPQIFYGLAEIAWRRSDTNAAIRNFQLYLANAPTNTVEATNVLARLKQLRPSPR